MDSTGTLDRLGCKVFMLLTNSSTGGLPLGVIITTTESKDAIVVGLKMLQQLLTDSAFGGRGLRGPHIFMTDNSAAERGALKEVFPETLLLLCQFHVLQAMWRYIWKYETGVNPSHRRTLFFLFKSLVYERNTEVFQRNVEKAFQDEVVQQYPIFLNHLEDTLKQKEDWAMCFRTNLITRGQNTNNISEASMRVSSQISYLNL